MATDPKPTPTPKTPDTGRRGTPSPTDEENTTNTGRRG